MEDLKNRKRSIDVNSLTQDEAERMSEEIGAKVRQLCDEACEKANKILNIYGMCAQMQIAISPIGEMAKKQTDQSPKSKRGRKPKATNL